jgi:hypothetical protein
VTLPDSSGNNHTVSFFDYVTINRRDGSITRVAGPDDTEHYQSVVRSMDGTTTTSISDYEPTTKTYVRRWKIEPYVNIDDNHPVAGAYRITVNLSLSSATGNRLFPPAIQMQAVR